MRKIVGSASRSARSCRQQQSEAVGAERFEQIGSGSGPLGALAVLVGSARAADQHGYRRHAGGGTQLGQQFVTMHSWHLEVGDDQAVVAGTKFFGRDLSRALAVSGRVGARSHAFAYVHDPDADVGRRRLRAGCRGLS